MADDFDPYYTWLGIPPEEQPADLYRLLGVRRYESNADVLTNAMDQRMHYLRSLQVGKRSALSQKILNEVSSAGVVLLDPVKRAEYDQQLRAKEAKAAAATPANVVTSAATVSATKTVRPLPMATSLPKAASLAGQGTAGAPSSPNDAAVVVSTPASATAASRKKKGMWSSPVVIGGAAFAGVALLGLVGIVVLSLQKPPTPVSAKGGPTIVAETGKRKTGTVDDKDPKKNGNQGTPTSVDPPDPDPNKSENVAVAADGGSKWWDDAAVRSRLHILSLSGAAHAEVVDSAPLVTFQQPFTVEAWVRAEFTGEGWGQIFGTRGRGPQGTAGWSLMAKRKPKDGKLVDVWQIEICKPGNRFNYYFASTLDPSRWTHLAFVHVPQGQSWLCINGKPAVRVAVEGDSLQSGQNLRLGNPANFAAGGPTIQVCGLRISDAPRYTQPFAPPTPLAMDHDASTAALLHFTLAAPNAAAGTVRRDVPDWKYGFGQYDDGAKKIASFTPMLEWNGLQWKAGPSAPKNVGEWMSLDPLGGHAGNGAPYSVIRRWIAPADGNLAIAGSLTHAHETRYDGSDGVRSRVVSSSTGEAGVWSARYSAVNTKVDKLAVKKGDTIDFVVECLENNHCDKFAWQAQLTLADDEGKLLGSWDTEKDFQGPNKSGAVYQLAQLKGARWERLDGGAVALTQLAPLPSLAPSPASSQRVNLIEASFDSRQHIRGEVTRDGTAIRTGTMPTAFMLPADLPDEYVLEADIVRESGEDSICIGIPLSGGRKMTAIVDGQKGTKSGLSSVNGQQIFTPGNPLVHDGKLLTNGQQATVGINVRKSGVELSVNGQSISKWDIRDGDTVATAKGMNYTDPRAVAIFTWNSPIRINRLEAIPATVSSTAPLPSGGGTGRIELVQTHGKRMQLVRGTLAYSETAGLITSSTGSAFMFPEKIPGEYVLEAEVVREEGTGSISFHLPVGGKALSAIIDIYDSKLTGLSDINDWNIQSADNPTVHRGPVLTNGQPAKVRIVVNQQEVSLSVDGKKLSSWPYDPSARLVGYQGLRLPDLSKLGITTGNSKFRIVRLELNAGNSPSPPALASDVPTELIDAQRRTVRGIEGSHQVSGSVLTTGNTKSRVVVDRDLPDEYTLEAEITRLAGNDTLGIGIPVQGRPLCILIDGWNSDRSGICLVPGQDPSDPGGSTIRKGPLLTNGQPARLRVVVSRQEVVLEMDGKTVASWINDPAAAIQAFPDYEPDGRKLAITTFSLYRIASLKLSSASAGTSVPASPPATGFAGPKKNPIPDAAAKAKAQTQITAVFGDKLKGAKTPPAKSALAKEISDLARDTRDLATKYTMLEEAQRLLVEVKEVGPALQTVDAIAKDFDVPPLPAKVKLLGAMVEGTLSAAQRGDLVAEACGLGFEAIDSDQFELAQALANVARTAASRATSADVKAEAKEFTDEFAQRHKRWDAVRKADKTLAAAPEDKGANLTLGLYHLFDRNDQAKGLPLVIKGSDAKLAAAAKARQASVAGGLGGSVEEADAWFDCLATAPPDYKAAIQKRALDAYELALSSVDGIEKARVTKRRDQLKADLASSSASAPGSKREPRIRKSDLPESSPGMVGRVILGGKDAGVLVTFNASSRPMDADKLRRLLTNAKVLGGRIVLEGVLVCPTPMSMRVSHRGASTNATQQILINGKNLSTVGGNRGEYDNEQLQLGPGTHLVQWVIDFDGSIGPSFHVYEDSGGRTVPLSFTRDQNYGARKLTTTSELDLTDSRFGP
jgi:hypothetical protein